MEIVVHVHWIHHNARIESEQTAGNVAWITPKEPERDAAFRKPPAFFKGCTYFFENAYDFIGEEREWFLDPATHTLYCKPARLPAGQQTIVEVPVLDTLIEIAGTPAAPVHDLEFRGLTIPGLELDQPVDARPGCLAVCSTVQRATQLR